MYKGFVALCGHTIHSDIIYVVNVPYQYSSWLLYGSWIGRIKITTKHKRALKMYILIVKHKAFGERRIFPAIA